MHRRLPKPNFARLGACLALAICLLAGLARPADAHAVLVASDPNDRAVLDQAPDDLRLTFDEPVTLTQMSLVASDGAKLPIETATTDAEVVGHITGGRLAAGIYTLTYRVISADGHVVGGAIQFSIGTANAQWNSGAGPDIAIQRWELAGLGWLAGLAGFLCFGLPLPWRASNTVLRRWGDGFALLSIAASALAIGIQGIAMQGGDIGIVDPDSWRAGLASPAAQFAGLIIAGVLLQRLAVRVTGRHSRLLQCVAAALVVGAYASTGHVHALGWQPSLILAAHVAVALFWVGSLPALLRRLDESDPAAALRRFSTMALPAVAILAAAGAALAWVQVMRPGELIQTNYGNVLIAKLALVGILLGLAAFNRWRLTPAIESGRGTALRLMRRSIQAELIVLMAILALTAALGELTPPRHLLASSPVLSRPVISDRMSMDRDAMAMVTVAENADGSYALSVTFSDETHPSVRPQTVTAEWSNAAAGIGPIRRDLASGTDGAFRAAPTNLAPRGSWQLTIKADFSDFDRRIFVLAVKI